MVDAPATLPDLDQLDPAALKILVMGQHGDLHQRLGNLIFLDAKIDDNFPDRQLISACWRIGIYGTSSK